MPTAALLTRMSRPPNRRAASSTMALASPSRRTSPAIHSTRAPAGRPCSPSASADAARAAASRPVMRTWAPDSSSAAAMARPMPLDPPVTIAALCACDMVRVTPVPIGRRRVREAFRPGAPGLQSRRGEPNSYLTRRRYATARATVRAGGRGRCRSRRGGRPDRPERARQSRRERCDGQADCGRVAFQRVHQPDPCGEGLQVRWPGIASDACHERDRLGEDVHRVGRLQGGVRARSDSPIGHRLPTSRDRWTTSWRNRARSGRRASRR